MCATVPAITHQGYTGDSSAHSLKVDVAKRGPNPDQIESMNICYLYKSKSQGRCDICLCECACLCAGACTHVCMRRLEKNLGYHSSGSNLLAFGDGISHWPGAHQIG